MGIIFYHFLDIPADKQNIMARAKIAGTAHFNGWLFGIRLLGFIFTAKRKNP